MIHSVHTLADPWTLHFDCDGTEDFGIIRDAHGNDIAASHVPCTRIGGRTFQRGTFWLPESSADVMDTILRQLRLMTTAPKLYRALEYLLEQTVEQDLKYGVTLSEGEEDARTQARTALAEAAGASPEPRKHFRVEVIVRTREVYRVAATNAEDAEAEWWDGQLVETDDSLENEILSVEEEQT